MAAGARQLVYALLVAASALAAPSLESPVNVLVVDDHRSYAEAISIALDLRPELAVVGCVDSVDAALLVLGVAQPDIVILDWQLPGLDGVAGIGRIRLARPTSAVVLVTGHASAELERLALLAGASAVLAKQCSIADIASVLLRVMGGETISTESVADDGRPSAHLTPREAEVLWLLSKGRDAPAISTELFLSVHTVRGYIRDLFRKLDAHSQLELVARGRERGLIPDPA